MNCEAFVKMHIKYMFCKDQNEVLDFLKLDHYRNLCA